jgi:hypothetical protein
MASDRIVQSKTALTFPRECMVCGRSTPLFVSHRWTKNSDAAIALFFLLFQAFISLPLSLLLKQESKQARMPLCLRHQLSHAFPGVILPITVLLQLLLVVATFITLAVYQRFPIGLWLAALSIFWLFVVTTAAHYAPRRGLPINLRISERGFRYAIRSGSHYSEDNRLS